MRILRLLSLIFAVSAAYWAYHLIFRGFNFQDGPLARLPFPSAVAFLEARLPASLSARQLGYLAFTLLPTSIILLSLAAPVWHGETQRVYRAVRQAAVNRPTTGYLGAALITVSAILLGSCLLAIRAQSTTLLYATIALTIPVYGAGLIILQRNHAPPPYQRVDPQPIQPYHHWMGLVAVLAVVVAILIWILPSLPFSLDAFSLAHASLAASTHVDLVAPIKATRQIAASALIWPSHLLGAWTGDVFRSGILRGALAATAVVVGSWLVACELLRRTPTVGQFGEPLQDDGAWPAQLTAAALPAFVGFFHLARIPFVFEPVALGLLGLWLLLLGARTRNLPTVGLSALLTGSTPLYGSVGILWITVGLAAWLGIWLFQRAWLTGRRVKIAVTPRTAAAPIRVKTQANLQVGAGLGMRAIALWALGVLITGLPAAAGLLNFAQDGINGALDHAGFATPYFAFHIDSALPTLSQHVNAAGDFLLAPYLFDLPLQLSGPWLGPLLLLALIVLLVNLDHLVGWIGAIWLACVLLPMIRLDPASPAQLMWLAAALPALALALAMLLDRLRAGILHNLGSWNMQATVYACTGLLIASLAGNLVTYVESAALYNTPTAELARHLPPLLARGPVYIATEGTPAAAAISSVDLSRQTLSAPHMRPIVNLIVESAPGTPARFITPDAWPRALPTDAHVLIAGGEVHILARLRADFGPGTVSTQRDLHSNPVLYIYTPSP
ncbi:MAG: hypothetical protein WDZ49_11940 [Litorilinea sp.]